MRRRSAVVVAGLALGLTSGSARAAFVDTFKQVGSNVVLTGEGTLDTASLGDGFNITAEIGINPVYPYVISGGQGSNFADDLIFFSVTSSVAIGSPKSTNPSSSSGDVVGLERGNLHVPRGYVSGTALVTSATFDNQTFASLGLVVGSYTYKIGSGVDADTFTIDVGVSAVPLPASAPMFGAALLALGAVGYGLKRKNKAAAAV